MLDAYFPEKRSYTKFYTTQFCEHCDAEKPQPVRLDYLRGMVCKDCDSALDEMLNEWSR